MTTLDLAVITDADRDEDVAPETLDKAETFARAPGLAELRAQLPLRQSLVGSARSA